jgi:hypothetical protein
VSTPFGAGTVYFENRHTLGVRTPHALYRFLRGLGGQMIASHHIFTGPDTDTEAAWATWLEGALP